MRHKALIFCATLLGGLIVVLGYRALTRREAQPESVPPFMTSALPGKATPADRLIQAAQNLIRQTPSGAKGYNLLSAAYLKKARETGDFGYNTKAEAALARSLEIAPANYEALKLRAALLLVSHRFREALEVARQTQALAPRDYENYGAMTDALVELGDYEEAIKTAQIMVDLRPDTASYSRVSYLRALHGDRAGAIEAMRVAAESASPQDPEMIAWCRVQLGDELLNAGRRAEAEREYDLALYVFPEYHTALAAKARARLAAGESAEALSLYRRAQELVPLPETAIALGDLYAKLGRADEAQRQYQFVEVIERAGTAGSETYSRQLALFWADHDIKLDEALAAARRERAARADIYTSDALAWCLFKKGQLAEAKTAMDEALRLGTRDPRLLYHAGMIYHGLGERGKAAQYLKSALAINASFDPLQADAAREVLRTLAA